MAEWKLTDAKINDLQVASIDRLIPRCKLAHFVNVRVRINGRWEEYEADWIKHMTRTDQPSVVLTNPWTGEPRDIRDVESDPAGLLMVEPEKPLLAAVQPNAARKTVWKPYDVFGVTGRLVYEDTGEDVPYQPGEAAK